MGPKASRSSSLRESVDVSDRSGEVDVLKVFSRENRELPRRLQAKAALSLI
jgi:hypothetical protein